MKNRIQFSQALLISFIVLLERFYSFYLRECEKCRFLAQLENTKNDGRFVWQHCNKPETQWFVKFLVEVTSPTTLLYALGWHNNDLHIDCTIWLRRDAWYKANIPTIWTIQCRCLVCVSSHSKQCANIKRNGTHYEWLVTHGSCADVSQHLQQTSLTLPLPLPPIVATNISEASPYQLTNLHTYDKMQINSKPR